MITRRFEEITQADVSALLDNEVPEGKTLDYKLELPASSDGARKELLADITSFANTAGGDLIFGVAESEGIPSDAPGLIIDDVDGEILRIDSMIRAGASPRIPGVQIKAIKGFAKGPVLLIRVPRSWAGPHMVTAGNSSRFYIRSNAGKSPMDVDEIRAAFIQAASLPDRIRRFRVERLAAISSGDTPVPLHNHPKMVLHIVPVSAFGAVARLHALHLKNQYLNLLPLEGGCTDHRFNIDGYLTLCGPRQGETSSRSYCQTYRNGIIESVDADDLKNRPDFGGKVIASIAYEENIIHAVQRHLQAYQQLELDPPVVVMLSMLGVQGYKMAVSARLSHFVSEIDRSELLVPEVLIEDFATPVHQLLKPIFDAVWNATGFENSLNYDEEGNWTKDRQR